MQSLKDRVGIGSMIRRRAQDRHWSLADLAMMAGLSHGYLCRVCRGEQEPSWSVACRLADALGVDVGQLRYPAPITQCPHCNRFL